MIANEQVDTIRSREDFIRFTRALVRDLDQAPHEWENNDLRSFLEAMAAWTEAMDGWYRNVGETMPVTPSWKTLGQILAAAKVYE